MSMALVGNFTQNADNTTQTRGASLHRTSSTSQTENFAPALRLGNPITEHLPSLNRFSSRKSFDGGDKPSSTYPHPHARSPSIDGGAPLNEYEEYHANQSQQPPQTMEETMESRTQNIHSLARQLSTSTLVNPFEYEKDSEFDPFSSNFDARKWTHHMVRASDGASPRRQAGISFRNLGVHGFGSDAGESTASSSCIASVSGQWEMEIHCGGGGSLEKRQLNRGADPF